MRRSQLTATLSLFFSLALIASQTLATDFTGRVVGVADGDTITVLHNGKGERIRLHGIDCPEKRQAFGNRAKQFTSNLVFAKTVTVQAVDRDRYGRTVGVVLLPDGRSLNHELVRAGLAWMYRRYTNCDPICIGRLDRTVPPRLARATPADTWRWGGPRVLQFAGYPWPPMPNSARGL